MAVGAHDQQVAWQRLHRAGDHGLGVAQLNAHRHREARRLQHRAGVFQLLRTLRLRLARHQQVDGQALEQGARGNHLDALPGHTGTVEREQYPGGGGERIRYRQHGLVHRSDHPFEVAPQVALCGACRGATTAQHEQAHIALQFGERGLQVAVALPYIDHGRAGRQRTFAQAIEVHAARLAGGARSHRVLVAQLLEQGLLRTEADGTAVVLARFQPGMPVDDVQQFQGGLHLAGRPGRGVRHARGIGGLVHAGENFLVFIHVASSFSGP